MKFECDEQQDAPQGLDDIVIERSDGRFEYCQVKYTPNPQEHFLTWEWLTEKKSKCSRSNIKKWFDALKKIPSDKLVSAKLVANRIPDKSFSEALSGKTKVKIEAIAQNILGTLHDQLGDIQELRWFLIISIYATVIKIV